MLDRLTKFLDWIGTWYNEKVSWALLAASLTALILFGVFTK